MNPISARAMLIPTSQASPPTLASSSHPASPPIPSTHRHGLVSLLKPTSRRASPQLVPRIAYQPETPSLLSSSVPSSVTFAPLPSAPRSRSSSWASTRPASSYLHTNLFGLPIPTQPQLTFPRRPASAYQFLGTKPPSPTTTEFSYERQRRFSQAQHHHHTDSALFRIAPRDPEPEQQPECKMSTNLQDYEELLTAEQHVQVDKLRESARNGVLPRVRGEVWMYLLDVLSSDKTGEMTLLKTLRIQYQALPYSLPSELASVLLRTALAHHTRRFESPTYETLITSLTAERPSAPGSRPGTLPPAPGALGLGQQFSQMGPSPIIPPGNSAAPPPMSLDESNSSLSSWRGKGFLLPPPNAPPKRHVFMQMMEEVLGKYWHASGCSPQPTDYTAEQHGDLAPRPAWHKGDMPAPVDWVYLATPFMCCLSRPIAVFYTFEKLLQRMESFPPLPSRLGSMLGLFRIAIPELHSYFEDEQVPMVTVAMSWMTTLLSREMWLGDVLRLWDSYFASDDMFSLHCYVCVAILATCKETLEELDGSEAKLMLLDLPPMDVDRLLQDAANLKVQYTLPSPITDSDDEC